MAESALTSVGSVRAIAVAISGAAVRPPRWSATTPTSSWLAASRRWCGGCSYRWRCRSRRSARSRAAGWRRGRPVPLRASSGPRLPTTLRPSGGRKTAGYRASGSLRVLASGSPAPRLRSPPLSTQRSALCARRVLQCTDCSLRCQGKVGCSGSAIASRHVVAERGNRSSGND